VPTEFKLVTPSPYSLTIYINTTFPSTPKYHQLFRTFAFLYQNYSRISYFLHPLYGPNHSTAHDLLAVTACSNEDKLRGFLLRHCGHYHLIAYFLGQNILPGTTFRPEVRNQFSRLHKSRKNDFFFSTKAYAFQKSTSTHTISSMTSLCWFSPRNFSSRIR